jgi:uncharacterized membrane protein
MAEFILNIVRIMVAAVLLWFGWMVLIQIFRGFFKK